MNRFVLAFLVATILSVSSVHALTLDKFNNSEDPFGDSVEATTLLSPVRQTFTVPQALGGFRTMEALKRVGALGKSVELVLVGGELSHSQDAGAQGDSLVIWDGDSVNPAITSTGLGHIDFLQDIDTLNPLDDAFFKLKINSLDLFPTTVKMTVYSDDVRVAELSQTITNCVSNSRAGCDPSPKVIEFWFKDFTPANSVDFRDVGAITLSILGGAIDDIDLSIDSLTTNGCNDAVPTSSSTSVDQCGVICGNNSCLDCEGVPNGTAQPGDACLTGQHGLCSPGTYVGPKPNCTCEPDNQPTAEICDGLDNNCDGNVDENFPTVGTTCSEGKDLCSVNGIFECDGNGGLKCTASDKKADVKECDESRGCDDVPKSGLIFDACGVCGGDGSSCADCAGTPNGAATLDRCNECNGDGLSCLDCADYDITETQFIMDAGAKAQEKMIKRVLRELKRVDSSATTLKYITETKAAVHELQVLNWVLSWTLPSVYSECTNTFCVNSSNEDMITEYQNRSLELKQIGKQAIRKLIKAKKAAGLDVGVNEKRHRKRQAQQHATNIANADSVPRVVSACN